MPHGTDLDTVEGETGVVYSHAGASHYEKIRRNIRINDCSTVIVALVT